MRDASSPSLRSPAAPLTVAVCATLTSGLAAASPVVVDINPDVGLGTYDLAIGGSGTLFHFFTDHRTYPCVSDPTVTCNIDENLVNTLGTSEIIATINASAPSRQTGTYVTALLAGETIDASRTFMSASPALLSGKDNGTPYGAFGSPTTALYAGLRFDLTDGTHYGWIEATTPFPNSITLTRYGYESDPGVGTSAAAGLAVPEPGTLGLLALGAAGVLAMRRRSRRH